MPDIMRDWYIWWLDFWTAHPVIFWGVLSVSVILTVATELYKRR